MKKESRLKKAGYSIIFLGVYQIVVFLSNLIVPRLILSSYGSEYNGIISSITQLLNFISILRIGVAGATRIELYKSLSNNDIKQTSAIINATEKFMRKIAFIFIIYVIILTCIYPFFVDVTYSFVELALLIIAIGIGVFAQYFFGITYSTLLQADQKLYVYNIIQIIGTIINTITTVVLIKIGVSIQIVKFATAIIFALSPLILNIYVRKKYKLDKTIIPDDTALKNRKDVVGHSLANIVHENTDITILTFFCNVKIVSVYSVYHLVINGLKQVMEIFLSGLESVFGEMWVKKEHQKIEQYLNLYEYFISVFISIIYSAAIMLIMPFVILYTKGVTDVNYNIPLYAMLALIAQIIYCVRMPYLTIIHSAGKYKETKKSAVIEALLNVLVSSVLVNFIGIYGVAIGTLIANLYRTLYYEKFLSNELIKRKSRKVFIKRCLWIIVNICSVISLTNIVYSCFGNTIDNWIQWCLVGMISVSVSIVVIIVSSIVFYKNDLYSLLKIIKQFFEKWRK